MSLGRSERFSASRHLSRSQKPDVIERIYESFLGPNGQLTRTVVRNNDIVEAIDWCIRNKGSKLSKNNPANFLKDIIRGQNASGMWPESLKTKRIGARQVTGDGRVFEFTPYAVGQTEPFPDKFPINPNAAVYRIQSVSMPLASKNLGRDDETYLLQVAVKLNVVETHFALHSEHDVIELNHLQIGIKLRLCEVDSLFSAQYKSNETINTMIITAEAKKKSQRVLEEQIIQQVKAAFLETNVELVVPIALRAMDGGIYIYEFDGIVRSSYEDLDYLTLKKEVLYELIPHVKGI